MQRFVDQRTFQALPGGG